MKDHTNCKRQFTQLSRAWYADANLPQGNKVEIITIGFYDPEGGTTGEFEVSWQKVGGRLTPKLTSFDDSWNALFNFSDMLEAMADIDSEDISPEDFCKLLLELGIEDATKEELQV